MRRGPRPSVPPAAVVAEDETAEIAVAAAVGSGIAGRNTVSVVPSRPHPSDSRFYPCGVSSFPDWPGATGTVGRAE
ncbi:hypothetical protein SBA1_710024 [Candidatus Sulfotelmatobacter kueseliae]|uniref:Uncharacterized protein n=1 Tax=Candidatus Sulfotelmatobacter kueseliae TaxID=2042962 RepID=A0A2U3L5C2_9BACT|nr:hypothetical protein SBA1_710024 [Candidatus Sulfotelmatobacter kueseliae]